MADSDQLPPTNDAAWDLQARHETPTERLDRNWSALLQELRVTQTGVQFLTGFLLTLPFQARFAALQTFQQNVYLVTVAASVLSTGLLITPVALHRLLFRKHAMSTMVKMANRLALAGLTLLGVAITGVVLLIFDVLRGSAAGFVAAGVVAVVLILLWLAIPLGLRRQNAEQRRESQPTG